MIARQLMPGDQRRVGVAARRPVFVVAEDAEHVLAAKLRELGEDREVGRALDVAKEVGEVELERRSATEAEHREQPDPCGQVRSEPRRDEGDQVGAVRVADEQDALAIPSLRIRARDPSDVLRRLGGSPLAPQVRAGIERDDGDAAVGENGRDLLVQFGEATVAGEEDGHCIAGAPGGDGRQWKSAHRGIGRRRALRRERRRPEKGKACDRRTRRHPHRAREDRRQASQ
jgi:hypothetical protein